MQKFLSATRKGGAFFNPLSRVGSRLLYQGYT